MNAPLPDTARVARVRRALLRFYDRERRDLPWRRTSDPYAIWISEVMLQQTRVETVRERFAAFLARFPDLSTLARAREHDVLKAWEGLGYYSRARNLRRAAASLVAEGRTRLPDTGEALRRLPGFGAYTAGAVASIAFGRRTAAVDGNVIRVLARWLGEEGDVTRAAARRRIEAVAQRLVPPGRPGDWNQALMELGAVVCKPRAPPCGLCPLRRDCAARASGDPARLPRRRARPMAPHHDVAAGLVWRRGRLLIGRRPADGLLGGLWELPGGKVREGETLRAACRREVREETGLDVRVGRHVGSIDHAYSHFSITLHVFDCEAGPGRPRALALEAPRFVRPGDLARYPFPAANRRLLEPLRDASPPA